MFPRVLLLSCEEDTIEQVWKVAHELWSACAILVASPCLDALASAAQTPLDLALLDLTLADPAARDLCRQLQYVYHGPMLMLSVEQTSVAHVAAFELGADQYLTKPFAPQELRARLRALARRLPADSASPPDETPCQAVIDATYITLSEETHEVWINERRTRLTPIELRLLRELMRHAGQTVSHRDLLRRVWGPVYAEEVEYLKVYVSGCGGR